MPSEYTVEQEINLLEQDEALLTETLADLQQQLKTQAKNQHQLQIKITEIQQELNEIKPRLKELKTIINVKSNSTANSTICYNVPALPPYLITPEPLFNELLTQLISKPSQVELAAKQKKPILIQSLSGMGKSVIASILAHNQDIQQTFSHGIFWVNLGQNPDLLARQLELIKALGGEDDYLLETSQATNYLGELCLNRRCLFILDDVWDMYDILAFKISEKKCQLLITTCDTTLIDFLKHSMPHIQQHELSRWTEQSALTFFLHWCRQAENNYSPQLVKKLIGASDYLPLTLKMIASQPISKWETLINILQQAQSNEFPTTHPRTSMQAMQIQVDALGEQGEYYTILAVFANYTRIPQTTVVMLWRYLYHFPTEHAYNLLNQLAEKGLLQLETVATKNYMSLHRFQYDYLNTSTEVDLLHTHLLAAYRRQCQHGWVSGPNDGYFFEYLCYHLFAAERYNELKSLLLDFDWMWAKLQVCPLHLLRKDYEILQDNDLNLIKKALLQAVPKAKHDRENLALQLLKSLHVNSSPELDNLLNQLKELIPT
jgi:hypothetical protein